MNRKSTITTFAGCIIALAGCQGEYGASAPITAVLESTCVPNPFTGQDYCFDVAEAQPAQQMCPSNRFVGVLPEGLGACPAAMPSADGAWRVYRPFEASTSSSLPTQPRNGAPRITGDSRVIAQTNLQRAGSFKAGMRLNTFARYCAYEWTSQVTTVPDMGALPASGASKDWLSPDCDIGAMSHPVVDARVSTLESNFMSAVDRVDVLPTPSTPLNSTYISVLDTSPTALHPTVSYGTSEHGRAITLLSNRLRCADSSTGPCLDGVHTVLTTKLIDTPNGIITDDVNGGHFGSLTDLAAAIIEAVDAAEARNQNNKIINLSVAWKPEFGGDYTGSHTNLPAPMRAVREAIGYAVCKNTIVIAAAGNTSHGPSASQEAMFPAKWETQPQPDATECNDLYGVTTAPAASTSSYRPLVYAVGAVNFKDQDLFNSRKDGMPSLVAPGNHAVLADVDPSGAPITTPVYSGSSISTAVVSSAAALAWSYQAALAPADIMQLIYDASVELDTQSDFGFNATMRTQRRVSMCAVVNAACTDTSCSTTCTVRPAYTPAATVSAPMPTSVVPTTVSAANLAYEIPVDEPCNATVFSSTPAGATSPCPSAQYDDIDTVVYVHPQPEDPLCPLCTIDQSALFFMGLNEELPGQLSEPVLVVLYDDYTKENFAIDIDPSELVPGASIEITDLDIDMSLVIDASIEFVVDEEYSAADLVEILEY